MNKKYILAALQRANRPNAVYAQAWEQRETIGNRLL
jgi:hypothetical protein